jgi:hydroxylaminobenzene mutase
VTGPRHPLDPDPVPSSKATAVLALGIVATATGALLGGVIPATVALVLATQAKRERREAAGFLLGGRRIRVGERLAWLGITLALTTLVMVTIIGLLHLAASNGRDFAPTVN